MRISAAASLGNGGKSEGEGEDENKQGTFELHILTSEVKAHVAGRIAGQVLTLFQMPGRGKTFAKGQKKRTAGPKELAGGPLICLRRKAKGCGSADGRPPQFAGRETVDDAGRGPTAGLNDLRG